MLIFASRQLYGFYKFGKGEEAKKAGMFDPFVRCLRPVFGDLSVC